MGVGSKPLLYILEHSNLASTALRYRYICLFDVVTRSPPSSRLLDAVLEHLGVGHLLMVGHVPWPLPYFGDSLVWYLGLYGYSTAGYSMTRRACRTFELLTTQNLSLGPLPIGLLVPEVVGILPMRRLATV